MIINLKTGRVAYHSLILRLPEDKDSYYVQYDYNGKKLDRLLTKDEKVIYPQQLNTKV